MTRPSPSMAVTPIYSSAANEAGEPMQPLYWVEDYTADEQIPIASYGGEPWRRLNGEPLPPDPGSPGNPDPPPDPPTELPIAWGQIEDSWLWNTIPDQTIAWQDFNMTVPG